MSEAHICDGMNIVCVWFVLLSLMLLLLRLLFASCYLWYYRKQTIEWKNPLFMLHIFPWYCCIISLLHVILFSEKCKHTLTSQFDYGQNIDLYGAVHSSFCLFVTYISTFSYIQLFSPCLFSSFSHVGDFHSNEKHSCVYNCVIILPLFSLWFRCVVLFTSNFIHNLWDFLFQRYSVSFCRMLCTAIGMVDVFFQCLWFSLNRNFAGERATVGRLKQWRYFICARSDWNINEPKTVSKWISQVASVVSCSFFHSVSVFRLANRLARKERNKKRMCELWIRFLSLSLGLFSFRLCVCYFVSAVVYFVPRILVNFVEK